MCKMLIDYFCYRVSTSRSTYFNYQKREMQRRRCVCYQATGKWLPVVVARPRDLQTEWLRLCDDAKVGEEKEGREERRGKRVCNWSTVELDSLGSPDNSLLASRSFVHPFVAVSNKNYDRLSHMLRPRGFSFSYNYNSLEWQLGSRIKNQEPRIKNRVLWIVNRESRNSIQYR